MLPPSWKSEVQKAIEEATDADRQQREAQQNNAASQITTAINALSDAQNAQTSSEEGNERKDRAISIVTLFLVFLTVIFTCLTWWTLSGQLTEMKSAGEQTKQLIEANGQLADAANKQATAAAENAKTAHDAYIASQRAWVGPNNAKIDGEIAIGKPFSIIVEYLNTGREPAVNFIYTTDAFASTAEEEAAGISLAKVNAVFKGCREAQVVSGGSVVFPSTGGFGAGQNLTLTQPDSFVDQNIIDGSTTIVVDGCFLYRSIGLIRHSYFCYFYKSKTTKPSNLNICQNGNGAD